MLLGIILSMVLAGANAYLGLFAGMTVSASIPAAVISMGILRFFKTHTILENNIVQTAASAGESLAAGVIFTIPALILMGYWQTFDPWEVAKIAAIGGLVGVLFTIPLRRALIIEAKLKFPEGIATAAVLETGRKSPTGETSAQARIQLRLLLQGGIVGGLMKLAQQAFALWPGAVEKVLIFGRQTLVGIGTDLSPALLSVGYIVGRNIAVLVFMGGFLSWGIVLPWLTWRHGFQGDPTAAAWDIWNHQIRYLGVGAMVVGGIWSFIELARPLYSGIRTSIRAFRERNAGGLLPREEQDIPFPYVLGALVLLLVPVYLLYYQILPRAGLSILLTLVMVVFGFLFSAVAAYMAGVVGSSNNPISGVTIATILFASLLLFMLVGNSTPAGAAEAIIIGAVVCSAAAIGGDNMQDLKTGQLVGATPWKQQIAQTLGTLSAAAVLGYVLQILHMAYRIGSPTLPAPQATLMKSVAEGVFNRQLPWGMVGTGAIIGVAIIILDQIQKRRGSAFRFPVLAVAVGIYLPLELSVPIFLGGMISHFTNRIYGTRPDEPRGVLLGAGLITGEAITGILVALPIFLSGKKEWWPHGPHLPLVGSLMFLAVIAWYVWTLKKAPTDSTPAKEIQL